jgi:hypothetical protein
LNGNIVKSLCAQGSRAEEQHAILERKLAEAAVRERVQQSELELLKAQRRADGVRQLREYEKELQEEKAKEAASGQTRTSRRRRRWPRATHLRTKLRRAATRTVRPGQREGIAGGHESKGLCRESCGEGNQGKAQG